VAALGRLLTFSDALAAGSNPNGGEGQQPARNGPLTREASSKTLVYFM
jgi:hypothetical protein